MSDQTAINAQDEADKMTARAVETAYPGVTGRLRDLEMSAYASNQSAGFAKRGTDGDELWEQAYAYVARKAAARAITHTDARIEAALFGGVLPGDVANPHVA